MPTALFSPSHKPSVRLLPPMHGGLSVYGEYGIDQYGEYSEGQRGLHP